MAGDHSHEVARLLTPSGPITIEAGRLECGNFLADAKAPERGRKNVSHPRAYKGHVLADDIEEGLGILCPGGLFRPILEQTIRDERESSGRIGVDPRTVFHAGGVKADSIEDLLRKFVDRDET